MTAYRGGIEGWQGPDDKKLRLQISLTEYEKSINKVCPKYDWLAFIIKQSIELCPLEW